MEENDIKIKNFHCSEHGNVKPIVEPKCPQCHPNTNKECCPECGRHRTNDGVLIDCTNYTCPCHCCDLCSDVAFEKTYPTDTAHDVCTNPDCPCHKECEVKFQKTRGRLSDKCCDFCAYVPKQGERCFCKCHQREGEKWEEDNDTNGTKDFLKCYFIVRDWYRSEDYDVEDFFLGRMASRIQSLLIKEREALAAKVGRMYSLITNGEGDEFIKKVDVLKELK